MNYQYDLRKNILVFTQAYFDVMRISNNVKKLHMYG